MKVSTIVRDVFLVVLGAGLAFGAEEWRDSRNEKKRVATAVKAIRAELVLNRTKVDKARTHHLRMADTLDAYVARHELPPERVYFGGVFNPAHLLSSAWETARQTGAVNNLPYQLVLGLAGVYDNQESYRALTTALGQNIMTDMVRQGAMPVFRDHFERFIPLEKDFANRETVLSRVYDQALVHLDSLAH